MGEGMMVVSFAGLLPGPMSWRCTGDRGSTDISGWAAPVGVLGGIVNDEAVVLAPWRTLYLPTTRGCGSG